MTSSIRYGTVNTSPGDDDAIQETIPRVGRWDDWIWDFLKGGTLSSDERSHLQDRLRELGGPHNSDTFLIHAESVRQIAYALFWITIAFAAIFTKLMISPDQIENSDLTRMFGYNNVR
jgi:hypothetical protein